MAHQLSRTELYELVWRAPRSMLAKQFSISDVGFSKICAAANIPQPPRGYWARLAAGKRVPRPVLPPRSLGQADLIQIGHAGGATSRTENDALVPAAPVFNESLDVIRARAATLVKRSRVPRNLQNPHQLVAAVLAENDTRREAVARNPHAWPKPDFATPASMRRVRIVNALLIVLAHAGARASLRGKDLRQFSLRVGDVIVPLELEAMQARTLRPLSMPPAQKREALRLAVTGSQSLPGVVAEWLDSEHQPLEQRIIEIARDILVFGEMAYRAAVQREYAWHVECKNRRDAEARAQRERLARETAERHARYDEQRRQWLQRQAENWQKAIQIRALIDAMDQRYTADDGVDYCHWRAWALAEADRLDPLRQPLAAVVEPPNCS